MTKKFDDFKADLIDLCKKHDVSLEVILEDEYLAVCDGYSEYNIKRIQNEIGEVGEIINH